MTVRLAAEDDFDGWRDAARRLAGAAIPPDMVIWQVGEHGGELFADALPLPPPPKTELRVSRAFVELAQSAILHRDPERFALLYRLLLRLANHTASIEDHADPLIRRIEMLAKAVRRDMHKMHAFVRFRELDDEFVAWFEPEHHIVRANAGFFVRRFAAMRWSILTPEVSLHWNGEILHEGPGADRSQAPDGDVLEEVWKAYYASIFNPARLKVGAMLKEMPRKYWKNMPEAELIAPLIAGAQAREAGMTAQVVPEPERARTLSGLREEAQACRRCPLWQDATQCVFGEGPTDARIMVVGEQPGDEEDKAGHPFVGPAGEVLARAMDEAGIDRGRIWLTNAVKHFKFVRRGKRRIHQSPTAGEIQACKWWLDQEIGLLRPKATVMLGASAIRGVTGKAGAVGALREHGLPLAHGIGIASYHPSYILRQPDRDASDQAYAALVTDLRRAGSEAGSD
ncbi:UdgX family uracil-DNA binding protein [Novosphingobium sp. JCM 18896]|uniref:UdgX family uracil-DNA binding protein n=1 Tax=Novosphingobium sp. JCM 18896 TaxID=2989731 RepID=UPI002223BD70|nr:UdgX family uracil-DNA binding protein [Novosphingobium sp. JCM 18896]MCW1429776.1 UdgX family uracil-DNA binding protein [Novosphingobium sp. JCM 18896]